MFARVRNIIVIAGALLVLLPSLTVGLGFVDLPRELEKRFAYVIAVVGLLVFFAVVVARTYLLRLRRPVLVGIFFASVITGLFFAGWLAEVMDTSVRKIDDRTAEKPEMVPYLEPSREHWSAELRTLIDRKYRGRKEAALKAERAEVLRLMGQDDGPVQRRMLILLALAHALILAGILTGAFAAAKASGKHANRPLD
jgi:hypothetical protein